VRTNLHASWSKKLPVNVQSERTNSHGRKLAATTLTNADTLPVNVKKKVWSPDCGSKSKL